jgi:hypothetical protein
VSAIQSSPRPTACGNSVRKPPSASSLDCEAPPKVPKRILANAMADSRIYSRAASQQSSFRERHHAMPRHDEMVERADIDECERLLQRLCEQLVGARRLGDT